MRLQRKRRNYVLHFVAVLHLLAQSIAYASTEGPYLSDSVTSLIGLKSSEVNTLFEEPIDDSVRSAILTFFDDDFANLEPPPYEDVIHSLREAYFLARFLSRKFNDTLRNPISEEDLQLHRSDVIPDETRTFQATESLLIGSISDDLRSNYINYADTLYKLHMTRSREQILAGASHIPGGGTAEKPVTVMILGAGNCGDIPLAELARQFNVVLVDIDLESMQHAISRLPEELLPRVQIEVRDLSGGVAVRDVEYFARIIRENRDFKLDALAAIEHAFRTARIPTPILEGDHSVRYLVSSMLISQIDSFIVTAIKDTFLDTFADRCYRDILADEYQKAVGQAVLEYRERIHRAHAKALADFAVREDGVVYYSSDLELRDVLTIGKMEEVLELNMNDALLAKEGSGKVNASRLLYLEGEPVSTLFQYFSGIDGIQVLVDFEKWPWTVNPRHIYQDDSQRTYIPRETYSTVDPEASVIHRTKGVIVDALLLGQGS